METMLTALRIGIVVIAVKRFARGLIFARRTTFLH